VEVEGHWEEMAVMVVYPSMKQVGNLEPRVVVLVDHCRGKGNLSVYDSFGCNCSIPYVDHASNYLGRPANHTSTCRQHWIGTGCEDLG
jgi:hypothetical protein